MQIVCQYTFQNALIKQKTRTWKFKFCITATLTDAGNILTPENPLVHDGTNVRQENLSLGACNEQSTEGK